MAKDWRTEMKVKPSVFMAALVLMLWGTIARADRIILKDGTTYSGKFIRGDSKVVEFQILSRIESFKTAEVAQIIFREPELQTGAVAGAPADPSAPVQPAAPAPEPKPRAAEQEAAPQKVPASTMVLPVGTPITIRTTTAIDTDRNRVGDVFDSTLEDALVSGSQTVAPRGALVKGRIAYAKESGKLTGQSQLILELTELVVNGKSYLLRTSDYTEVGSSRGKRTAATVGGLAAVGAIIGAVAGGGKGAAIGAGSGAAVGTGVQVITSGEVLKIPAETILEFKLQSPLSIAVP